MNLLSLCWACATCAPRCRSAASSVLWRSWLCLVKTGLSMDHETKRPPDTGREAPTPRWVYVVGIVVVIVGLGFAAMHFAGGGIPSHLAP